MFQPSVFTALMTLAAIVASPAMAHPDQPVVRVFAAPLAETGLVPLLLVAGGYALVRRYRNRRTR